MNSWLKRALSEGDGTPSASRLVLFTGLGGPAIVWVLVLLLVLFGVIEWTLVAGAMEWIKDYSALVVLPYFLNLLQAAVLEIRSRGIE